MGEAMAVTDATLLRAPVTATRPRRSVLPRTTPAWLRVAAGGIAIGCVLLAVTGAKLAVGRVEATDDVVDEATPLLVDTQDLYVALADADAAATTAYLEAGLEPHELRERYDDDIGLAGEKLAAIASHGGPSEAAWDEFELIIKLLPTYAELVGEARANNRQDFPVGAAYLRTASGLMREQLLPAAQALHDEAREQLHAGYRNGTSAPEVWVWACVGVVVVVALVITQVFLARRTRRVLNLGLLAATVLVVGVAVWTASALSRERSNLVAGQREGSDHFLVLSDARILTLNAMAEENLDLIERGTEPTHIPNFDAATTAIGDEDSGLLGEAERLAEDTGIGAGSLAEINEQYLRFLAFHDEVRALEGDGSYTDAVDKATGDEAAAAASVDRAYAQATATAHNRLTAAARDARQALRGLPTAMAVVALLAGLVAVFGLDRRIREYR
jgi:hypothetical protein